MKTITHIILFVSILGVLSCNTTPEPVSGTLESLLPGDLPLIRAATDGISPNGDGLHDTLDLFSEVGRQDILRRWVVEIRNEAGTVVRRFSGRASVPDTITWDGTDRLDNVVPDGHYDAALIASYDQNQRYNAETSPFRVALSGPEIATVPPAGLFSPDGDGDNDVYTVGITVQEPKTIASWEIMVVDPTGTPFYVMSGIGPPPGTLTWDGRSPTNELVQSATEYTATVSATDHWNNASSTTWPITTGILLISEDESYRIRVSSIVFQPFTADFRNVGTAERQANEETLDRLAEIFRRYDAYDITMIGHAVHIYWFRPERMAREQAEVLLPLSEQRAAAIREAFIERGIDAARMRAEGRGGSEPVVPHSDLTNRWKNRRVTFILSPRND